MKKEEILTKLRDAKTSHIKWVQRAKFLIEGLDIDKNAIPVDSTECSFGKWFYSDAQKLNSLRNNNIENMDKIAQLHTELHNIYLQIFKIYFSKPKGGFFSKIFGNRKKITEDEKVYARKLFNEIEAISKDLLNEVNLLERRIISIPDEEIENMA